MADQPQDDTAPIKTQLLAKAVKYVCIGIVYYRYRFVFNYHNSLLIKQISVGKSSSIDCIAVSESSRGIATHQSRPVY